MRQKQLLEAILEELKNIHDHLGRMEVLYCIVNNIKQDDKGVWIEDRKQEDEKKGDGR